MAAFYLLYLTSKGAIFLSLLYKISHKIRCKLMGHLCFVIALCSIFDFYRRVVFQSFLSFLLMDCSSSLKLLVTNSYDFGCGFLIFGCFSKFVNVIVVSSMLILGFIYLQYAGVYHKIRGKCKSIEERKGLLYYYSLMCKSSNNDDDEVDNGVKKLSFENNGTTKMARVLRRRNSESGPHKLEEIDEFGSSNCGFHDNVGCNGEESEDWKEGCHEDQVFDVMTLKNMVKAQRKRANAACNELEKERMAASSSVDEAMAMILRLQNEKSVLQMQVSQLQRCAEDKNSHDQEVIQSLQWIVMKHESERSILEEHLRMCREKIRLFVKGEEWDQFDSVCPTPSDMRSSLGSRVDDLPIGLLDFESSPL